MVRFNWLNHGMASLYSSVGIGVQYQYVKKYEQNPNRLNKFYNINPAFDLVGLGLRVGTNFFGFCEIGYGNCGIVKAGVGYRFNTKENQ